MQYHTNKMVNVSLCISISQVPKDTSYSRRIFSFPIGVHFPLAWAIKSLNDTWRAMRVANIEQPFMDPEASLYLPLGWGVYPSFLTLITNLSRLNWLIFLLKCDRAKVAAYVPPLGRIKSSRSFTNMRNFDCLTFCLDRPFGFSI